MKTLIFKTQLFGEKEIQREIEVPENFSLYNLAEAIINAYDFDFDHCFGFFRKISNGWDFEDTEKYELFTDLIEEGEDIEPTGAGSVKKTKVRDVWKEPTDRMLFLFDYGDERRWIVTFQAFGEKRHNAKYPKTFSRKGRIPRQR